MSVIRAGSPLFVYGSLMFPAIIKSVIGRVPESRPAIVGNYRRLVVSGEIFPGLIKIGVGSTDKVEGLIYAGITAEEWKRLIAFEDEFYELERIEVESLGESVTALAFVVPPRQRSLLSDEEWNPDHFRERILRNWTDS